MAAKSAEYLPAPVIAVKPAAAAVIAGITAKKPPAAIATDTTAAEIAAAGRVRKPAAIIALQIIRRVIIPEARDARVTADAIVSAAQASLIAAMRRERGREYLLSPARINFTRVIAGEIRVCLRSWVIASDSR